MANLISETNTKIVSTRKTTPNLRVLEKYAVKDGGGMNHRFGLYDGILTTRVILVIPFNSVLPATILSILKFLLLTKLEILFRTPGSSCMNSINVCFIRPPTSLNLQNVHVNRSPFNGTILSQRHKSGGYLPAFSKDSHRNERLVTKLDTDIEIGRASCRERV